MRGPLLLCLLALASCQSVESVARGDRAYRQGQFHQALEAYESAGDPAVDAELASRISRAKFALLVDGARDLLHHNDPVAARKVSLAALKQRPNDASALEILSRSTSKMAEIELAVGEEFMANERYPQAAASFERALGWLPESKAAQDGLARAEVAFQSELEKGEAIYFEGLDQIRLEKPIQAFTTLQHATLFLGDESRAKGQLDKLAKQMGEASRERGMALLEQGRIGEAWLALWDAERFQPGDTKTLEWLGSLEQHIAVEDLLLQADIAVRGSQLEAVGDLLEKVEVKALNMEAALIQPRMDALQSSAAEKQAQLDYRLARALEMDQQLVRAQGLYTKLTQLPGFQDVVVRQALIKATLDRASSLYAAGFAAESAEDFGTALRLYAEVMTLVIDYKDTGARLKGLAE